MNNKMRKCRTCDAPISKNAKTCPHCGEQSPQPISNSIINLIGALIFLAIIAIWGPSLIKGFLENAIKLPQTHTQNINKEKSKE